MNKFILPLIFFLALILRVVVLTDFPAGLNADEAALGYNAYSLIATGKDEFGHGWPLNFQSFNDWKPGLYVYLVLPLVKILGLNEWAVRLPSAILGSLTVLIIYFLAKEWFSSKVALVASALLAINPWHLHFSRGGWETNVATFFIVLGVYLFYLSLKKPKLLVFSIVSFCLSMFTYHSARVVSPLIVLGLTALYRKEIFRKKNIKNLVVTFLVGLVLGLVLLFSMLGEAGRSRFSGVGIFADQGPLWRVNELRGEHTSPQGLFPKVVHNKYFEYLVLFADNWLSHFDGSFLFISGDEIQRNRVPGMGQFYLLEIPFLLLGICFLLKNKPKVWLFILWWLAVAPVASALTFQSPHAIRSLNMVIPLVIINSYGISGFFSWLKTKSGLYYVLFIVYFGVYVWNFSFYLHQYYVKYPQVYPSAWEYGFKDLTSYLKNNESRIDRVYVTNNYDQPYILFAFYLAYPPESFQKEATLSARDEFGFSTVENFGKYYFGDIDLDAIPHKEGVFVVGTSEEIPDSATIAKRIYFKNGKEAFRIIEY